MLDQEDEGTRIGVWVALGVVFFVIAGLIGGLSFRQLHHKAKAPAVATAAKASGDEMIDAPLIGVVVGTLYFESGKSDLPADGYETSLAVVKAMNAQLGGPLVLSGFHDATGDPARNAELAKQRAMTVRESLRRAGADMSRVRLRKPESTTGGADDKEARRVEIRLLN